MSEEIVSGNAPIEPRRLIAKSEWARLRGVSPCYVSKLLKERKIVDVQGKIDSVEADRCLEASRLRVQNGHSNAGAIKQLKNAELEAKNEWRGPVLLYVDGKEHVVPIDVARCAFDLANPTEKDTLRVASILRSAGWRQRALQVGRKRGLVYVKPGWTPHKPQRTPLAEAILDLRNHFGEKQSGFAVRLGLTVTSVAKYETWGLPKRQVLGRLKQIAKEAGRDDLVAAFSAVRGVRQQDDCAVEDCQQERRSGSRYCRLHDLEKERAALKTRWATDREFRQKRRKYRLDGREKHNARVKQRRIEDEVFRNRLAYLKRAASFRSRIADRCTEAYLKAAKQEDETLTSALSAWIKSFRKRKTREERAEIARKNAQDKYWQDPEAEKRRVQAYKHSRPDYRKTVERGTRRSRGGL